MKRRSVFPCSVLALLLLSACSPGGNVRLPSGENRQEVTVPAEPEQSVSVSSESPDPAGALQDSIVTNGSESIPLSSLEHQSEEAETAVYFTNFEAPMNRDTDPNLFLRFLKNFGRNIKATGLYFLIGIALSAVFQHYVPSDTMTVLFGGNEAFGVLMAATIGVPLYACGGGTIPLLQAWLADGMSLGSAAAFMVTGPSTKITNLGALKIVLGAKRFVLYLAFVMLFSLTAGLAVNLVF